jgi:phosphoglycerate-specific signal transduction histidine kinase
MSIFSSINYYNNKIFISTTISFLLTLVAGLLFFVSAISHQTFSQDTLTIKEALEQSFGKENG